MDVEEEPAVVVIIDEASEVDLVEYDVARLGELLAVQHGRQREEDQDQLGSLSQHARLGPIGSVP